MAHEETTEEWMYDSFGNIVDSLNFRFPGVGAIRVLQGLVSFATLGIVKRILFVKNR